MISKKAVSLLTAKLKQPGQAEIEIFRGSTGPRHPEHDDIHCPLWVFSFWQSPISRRFDQLRRVVVQLAFIRNDAHAASLVLEGPGRELAHIRQLIRTDKSA